MNELDDFLGFNPADLNVYAPVDNAKGNSNPNIYKPNPELSKSEDGVYRATIKVLYNPFNFRDSIVEVQSYGITDANGWFSVVSSLTDNDKSCPIFKAWSSLHFSKDPAKQLLAENVSKGGPGYFDKRFARYATIQVIEDDNQPDLVGRYMIMKLPKAIYDMINNKQNPSTESKKAQIPVMDLLFGRTIELEVTPGPDDKQHPERKKRETSYASSVIGDEVVSCTNPDGSSLLNDAEQAVLDEYVTLISKVWKSKNPTEREELMKNVNAADCTKQLKDIYRKVIESVKSFCPNVREEVGFKPWSAEITTRVENYLKLVLDGKNPRNVDANAAIDAFAEANSGEPAQEPVESEGTDASADDDLPF